MAGYSVTYTVVDNATKQIDTINRRIAQMRAPMERMSRSVSRFIDVSGLRKVAQGFEWIGRTALTVMRTLGAIVPMMGAITGAASIAGMAKLVASYAEWSRELVQNADAIGMTTQELQKFQDATRLAGGNATDATESLKGLKDSLANLNTGLDPGKAATVNQWLGRLHMSARNADGSIRKAGEMMPKLVEELSKIEDPTDRAAASIALLGNEGSRFVETFRQSHRSLTDYLLDASRYTTLTDKQKEALQRFSQATGRVGVAFDHLGQQIAAVLARDFGPLLDDFAAFVEENTPAIIAAVDQLSRQFTAWLRGIDWTNVKEGAKSLLDDLKWVITHLDTIAKAVEFVAGLFVLKWGVDVVKAIGAVTNAIGLASGAGAIGLGTGLAGALAGIAAIVATLALGAHYETPETRKQREDLRKSQGGNVAPPNLPTSDYWVDAQGRKHDATTGALLPDAGPPGAVQRQSAPAVTLPGGASNASYSQPAVQLGAPGATGALAPVRDVGGSTGERNRNPLNLTALPGEAAEGRFRRFNTWEEGVAGAVRQLQINTEKHGTTTLAQQINRWAPASDNNDPKSYAARVAREMGIDVNSPVNTRDPETLRRMIAAMSHVELGRQVPPEAIAKGVAMATGAPVTVPPQAPVNGSVDVNITHTNPPPNSAVTAKGSGAVNVPPPRVEQQNMASI